MSTFYSSNKSPNILILHSAKWHKNHLVSMQYVVYIPGMRCLNTCIVGNHRTMKKLRLLFLSTDL